MKKILVIFCALAVCTNAFAADRVRTRALASVCPSTVEVRPNFIYKQSAPLRSGGVGTPLIGYRKEPTLICNTRVCGGRTTIYAANGTAIGSCPWATAHGHAGGRYRCTMKTATLRAAAVRKARSATIYFKLKNGKCARVPDAGRCYGSVKGLCNQLIR